MALTCPSCNTLNAEQAHFCKGCGESLLLREEVANCPKCGVENPDQARFCTAAFRDRDRPGYRNFSLGFRLARDL